MYYVPFIAPSDHVTYISWWVIILPCFGLLMIVSLFIKMESLNSKGLRKTQKLGKHDRPEHIILSTPTHSGKGVGLFDEASYTRH